MASPFIDVPYDVPLDDLVPRNMCGPLPPPAAPPSDPPVAKFGTLPLGTAEQLFIVQAIIIILLCKALSWLLAKIKQPSVIAEIISGIILGPTVMGHIPGFKDTIFPDASLKVFNVIAGLGLIFFMSLIGLEMDFDLMVAEWKSTIIISIATMVVPFAVSVGSSYAVWESIDFDNSKESTFATYFLFMGVAMCVTAFPVLARIVKEKQLFRARIGVTSLATAAWADVAAWTLLALSVSLINGGSKFNILWTFLCLVGFAIFAFGPLRWIMRKVLIRRGVVREVTPSLFAGILVLTLACAWFTEYVGIHSIFGAFIFGIILPREDGFCVKLAEKFEDFVTAFFLPLYFTASGLRTQLGLLNDGNTWGLLLLLLSVAIVTKVGSGVAAGRITGLSWRESFTLGVLMNTKGLVELIVLNIGLDHKLISPTTFSMMIVLALVTTFITSPVVHFSYPPSRVVEFENQTPGKTVLVAALRDRWSVAPMMGVWWLITSGRPSKYRLRVMRTMTLTDRPSTYMSKFHVDDVLEHVKDIAHILTLKTKTIALTNDSDSQKIEHMVSITQAQHADFYFTYWRLSPDHDERIDPRTTLGGSALRKAVKTGKLRGNLAILLDRELHSNISRITFIYTGSNHDRQAAKLVKAMLHTPHIHVTVIYAMNTAIHEKPVESKDHIKDAILGSLFIRARAASVELVVLHDSDLTTAIANALNSFEDPGLVVCGTDIYFNEPSKEGVHYREIIMESTYSFLCVSMGTKSKDGKSGESDDSNDDDDGSEITGILSPPHEEHEFSSSDDDEHHPHRHRRSRSKGDKKKDKKDKKEKKDEKDKKDEKKKKKKDTKHHHASNGDVEMDSISTPTHSDSPV